jgi:hypothetical protein
MEFPTQRDPPLRLQKMYKIFLSAARNFSFKPPAAQHQKNVKNTKKFNKELFQSRWIPVKYFSVKKCQFLQISIFSKSDRKTQFFNWYSVLSPELGQNYPYAQKPIIFNGELSTDFFSQFNLRQNPNTNSISGQYPNSNFPDFFQAISNSQITIIKFSFKNHTEKYKFSGIPSQFSHFSVNSYHFPDNFYILQ